MLDINHSTPYICLEMALLGGTCIGAQSNLSKALLLTICALLLVRSLEFLAATMDATTFLREAYLRTAFKMIDSDHSGKIDA